MKVFEGLANVGQIKNPVVTIGTFDGVHLGHQKILQQVRLEAEKIEGESVLLTFYPHPRLVLFPNNHNLQLLQTQAEKLQTLAENGLENVIILPFSKEFSQLSALDFVQTVLYNSLHAKKIIIGYDHQFGKGRKGNYELLEEYGARLGFEVKEIPKQVLQQSAISSTRVRKALLHQDIITAELLLGYSYFFEGIIIHGDQIGRTIGYPTANIQINDDEKLVPGDGVYAVRVTINNAKYQDKNFGGMMYIGSRPVVNGKRRVIEVNIFDFDDDIYDETMRVSVKKYIRGDMNLNGLEALKQQLAIDKENCTKSLK
jgi:riboflavin kinase/FMN adenylyltransferase